MAEFHIPRQTFDPVEVFDALPDAVRARFGRGLAYPPRLLGKLWDVADGADKIKQSMYVIITTPLGTRFMRPDFGSMVPYLVFSTDGRQFDHEAKLYTKQALDKWEPRITVYQVDLDKTFISDNAVNIIIYYAIKGVAGQFVFTVPLQLQTDTQAFLPAPRYTLRGGAVF